MVPAAPSSPTVPALIHRVFADLNLVDPALNAWLQDCVTRNSNPDEMVEAMVRTGRPLELAATLVHLARSGFFLSRNPTDAFMQRSGPGTPQAVHAEQHTHTFEGQVIRKVMSLGSLDVVIYENFITDEEIEYLKSSVEHRLERSYVVGRNFSNVTNGARTSRGAFMDVGCHPIVAGLEAKIASLTGIPITHGEGLQVLHYGHTEEYQPHFDFFEPSTPEEIQMMAAPGNRVGTLIMYLNEPEEGGSTYFPKLDLAVHPRKGSALWFGYMDKSGVLDQRSEHAGLPVIKGEKWIATKWLRQRPMVQLPVAQWTPDQLQSAKQGGQVAMADAANDATA